MKAMIVLLALLVIPAASAGAEYERIRWLDDRGEYVVYYSGGHEKLAREIEKLVRESSAEIASEIGLEDAGRVDIYIAADRAAFRKLHRGMLPEWGEAFSELRKMVIGIDAAAVLSSSRPLSVVVRHELSHIFFTRRVRGVKCPTWFLEGLAMRQSRSWTLADQWNLVTAIWRKKLPDLEDLEGRFPRPAMEASIAYRLSYAAVERLFAGRPGDLVTFTAFIRDKRDFDQAFVLTFGETWQDFTEAYHLGLEKKYKAVGAVVQSTPFWTFMVLLFLVAYIVKTARARSRVKEWERQDSVDS